MLEFFRQHVGGLLGAVVIGTLAVAFALSFGAQSAGWGKGQVLHVKATVDGDDIPETTLRYAMNLMGGRSADDPAQRVALQRMALDGLVERQLLVSLADEMGISADMDEALDMIAGDKIYLTRPVDDLYKRLTSGYFTSPDTMTAALVEDGHRVGNSFTDPTGKFNLESYRKFVRNYLQITEEAFEEQQRLELVAKRIRQILVSGVRISAEEVKAQYERENDSVTLEYLTFSPVRLGAALVTSPAAVAEWTAAHQDEVTQYYETNKFRYTGLEKQVRARHILIKATSDADEATKQAAKARVDELMTRIKAGEDFATLAKDNSEDTGSAPNGGDLGFNPKGKMVAAFDQAMFSTPAGEISEVVETEYGYHIIKVEEIREGDIPMEQATAEIAEKLMREAKGKERATKFADAALQQMVDGKNLEAIALSLTAEEPSLAGLEIETTRPVTRADKFTNTGMGSLREAAVAAFEADTNPAAMQKVFEINGSYAVGQVKERKKPTDDDYTQKRAELTRSLLASKQSSFLKDRLAEILAQAKKDGRIQYFGQADAQPVAEAAGPTPTPAATPIQAEPKKEEEASPEAAAPTKGDDEPQDEE